MKKFLLLMLLSTLCAGIYAAGAVNAKLLAQRYLAKKKGTSALVDGVITPAVAKGGSIMRSRKVAQADFLAYNATEGGFVLMAQAGGEPTVIGYSVDGTLSFDNMPDAMKEWMEQYRLALTAQKSLDEETVLGKNSKPAVAAKSNTYPEPTVAPVAPLISTKWGQDEPFNRRCPKYNGEPMVAGCTAVAMAQILNYYKSDNTGYDKLEYVNEGAGGKEFSVDYTKIKYDWANMLDVYEKGKYTDEQADAVAKLMFEAGVSCKAKYDISVGINYTSKKTSAAVPFVGFDRYYNYICDMHYRDYTPTKAWMKIIQDELTAGRPILYAGSSGSSSHAYIVDGIDEENNVHINWGWNGEDDGYYDVTFCKAPDEYRGYYYGQHMLTGIRPRTTADEPYIEQPKLIGYNYACGDDHWDYFRVGYKCITSNFYETKKKIYTGVGLSKSGKIITSLSDDSNGDFGGYPGFGKTYSLIKWTELPDGEYEVNTLWRESETDEWKILPVHDYGKATVTKNGEALSYNSIYQKDENKSARIVDIEPVTELVGKTPIYFKITTKDESEGTERSKVRFRLVFTNTETGDVYEQSYGSGYGNIYNSSCYYDGEYQGLTQTKVFGILATDGKGFAMPEGEYKISIEDTSTKKFSLDKDITIKVGPQVDYPILDYSRDLKIVDPASYYYWGNNISIYNTACDLSANKVDGIVTMSVYARPVGGGDEIRLCSYGNVAVPSEQRDYIILPNSLYPLQGEYELYMRYTIPGGERGILNPCEKSKIKIVSNESDWQYVPKLSTTLNTYSGYDYVAKGTEQTVSVPLTNIGANDFSGTYTATFYCKENGKYIEKTFENQSLKSGESTTVEVPVTFPEEGIYEMQFFAKQNPGYNMMTFNTFVTDTYRQPLNMRIGVGTSGVNTVQAPAVSVYPNPASEWIKVSGISGNTTASIISAAGTEVGCYELTEGGKIDVSHLPAGMYIVKLPAGEAKLIKR